MDYEELAKKFCEMNFLCLRKKLKIEETISVSGEDGVLLCIHSSDHRVLSGEIAGTLRLSPGRTTNIINVLEKRGYIVKENDRADKRKVYVSLTSDGERHIMEKYNQAIARYCMIFEKIGEQDAEEYFRILKRIHKAAEEMMKEGMFE